MQRKKTTAPLIALLVVVASSMPAQASAEKNKSAIEYSEQDPFANHELENGKRDVKRDGKPEKQKGLIEKPEAFKKIYSLPLPLPTGRRAISGKDKNSIKSIEERTKRLEAEKKFPKNYTLAQTFDLPSIEESKPVTERKKFQKYSELPDPFVKFNRYQFKSSRRFEKYFFRPLAKGWRKLPNIITTPIINFSKNLTKPTHLVNALLQGNPLRAIEAIFSFTVNSTIGFGGIINVAKGIGIPDEVEDFGQTMAIYGIRPGAYLLLLEPSSVRDTAGSIVDAFVIDRFINPAQYLIPYYGQGVSMALGLLIGLDKYGRVLEQIKAIEQGSIDLYVTTRRFYAYSRALQILNIESEAGNNSSAQKNAGANQNRNRQTGTTTEDPFAELEEEPLEEGL